MGSSSKKESGQEGVLKQLGLIQLKITVLKKTFSSFSLVFSYIAFTEKWLDSKRVSNLMLWAKLQKFSIYNKRSTLKSYKMVSLNIRRHHEFHK